MAKRPKRAAWARAVVVAAVCALPLVAVGSAQAAIAGANPTKTANPNLVSATVTSVVPAKVRICFDKPISDTSGVFDASNFDKVELTGYRSANKVNATGTSWDGILTGGNPNCLTASFNVSGSGDINQFTAVTVLGEQGNGNITTYKNMVVASGNGRDNISDSVPLTGSFTHNGTSGNTTAPDLVGVTTPDTTHNTITYVFNKAIASGLNTPLPQQFFFENGGGQVCTGDPTSTPVVTNSATGFTITVAFATGKGFCLDQNSHVVTVGDAIRAGVFQDFGAAVAASDSNCDTSTPPLATHCAPNPLETVIVPNQTGQTSLPDLTGASLHTDFNTVSYTFNQPIAANSINPSDFTVFNSDGSWIVGCSANIGGSNTVNVLFANPDGTPCPANDNFPGEAGPRTLANQAEYAVLAAVDGIAIEGSQNNIVDEFNSCQPGIAGGHPGCRNNSQNSIEYTNSPGSVPIGDNSGAFARGFTTGPDAYAVTINQNNGVVTLTFDQRVLTQYSNTPGLNNNDGPNTEAICIYRADGTLGGCDPDVTPTTFPGPGPQTVNLDFTAAQATGGVAVQLAGSSSLNRAEYAFQTDLQSQNSEHDAANIPQSLSPIGTAAVLHSAKVHHKKHHKHHRSKKY